MKKEDFEHTSEGSCSSPTLDGSLLLSFPPRMHNWLTCLFCASQLLGTSPDLGVSASLRKSCLWVPTAAHSSELSLAAIPFLYFQSEFPWGKSHCRMSALCCPSMCWFWSHLCIGLGAPAFLRTVLHASFPLCISTVDVSKVGMSQHRECIFSDVTDFVIFQIWVVLCCLCCWVCPVRESGVQSQSVRGPGLNVSRVKLSGFRVLTLDDWVFSLTCDRNCRLP